MVPANRYDIAVVGGGLVGASLALALAPHWRVILIESGQFSSVADGDIPAGPWDERCLALNDGSRRIYEGLALWPALSAHAAPIRATQISERGRFGVARFTAVEAGLDALGWNVPVRVIGTLLWQRLRASQVELLCCAEVENVQPHDDRTVLDVALHETGEGGSADAEENRQITARLVVAADGADSTVREKLGIGTRVRDYRQHAIISTVKIARPHRDVAYERFTPEGPFALLPKAPDACSVIHTVPSIRLDALMALDDASYLAVAQDVFGGRLGRFLQLGRRMPHALTRVLSHSRTASRVILIGNASQNLHPVAAQGFNLGLRDAANLAATLAVAADPGEETLLADFARSRESDRKATSDSTDLLARAFSTRLPGISQVRHWGLLGVQLAPFVHRRMLRQHLGHCGLPPGA